jgi:hypothetical protein
MRGRAPDARLLDRGAGVDTVQVDMKHMHHTPSLPFGPEPGPPMPGRARHFGPSGTFARRMH